MHFADATPIYLQIAEDLRTQILNGSLEEGAQVMSTTRYTTTYQINPATAARAFAQLVAEDLLEKRRGVGVFVRPGARDALRERGRNRYWDEVLAPALDQGVRLGLDRHELVNRVRDYLGSRKEECR